MMEIKTTTTGTKFLDFNTIRNMGLSYEEMYNWTTEVWKQQDNFTMVAKSRMQDGEAGRFMTMPCILNPYNISGVKFICRNVDDFYGMPARNSNIILQRNDIHGLYAVLDGTFITTMRTGACAAFNVLNFQKKNPKSIAVYGLGLTATAFMLFYSNLIKDPIEVKLMKYKEQEEVFIKKFNNNPLLSFKIVDNIEDLFNSDIIVSCVSFAHQILCNEEIYPKGCTIVPVHTSGFQNCDLVFDKVIVDDIDHVKKYRYYEQFKNKMERITDVVNGKSKGRTNNEERIVIYNGGLAIHDMFWAMKIVERIDNRCPVLPMNYPMERFWL